MKIELEQTKPRNWIARDLRTPKYRMRVVKSKKSFKRVTKTELKKELENA